MKMEDTTIQYFKDAVFSSFGAETMGSGYVIFIAHSYFI
tara:strand:+ start:1147 stop:1263 length:117 start_codon:yes stop_codon:yes gene_type:complete